MHVTRDMIIGNNVPIYNIKIYVYDIGTTKIEKGA